MRQVEFRTFLLGGVAPGHRVFIAAPGLASFRALVRVHLNGVVFDAESWPSDHGHLIEVPHEVMAAARLKPGEPASVELDIMGH